MNIASEFCHWSVISCSFFRFMQQRQVHFKERAGSDFALYADFTAMSLDNPLYNREAQSASPGSA
jgi:hypothetical protein